MSAVGKLLSDGHADTVILPALCRSRNGVSFAVSLVWWCFTRIAWSQGALGSHARGRVKTRSNPTVTVWCRSQQLSQRLRTSQTWLRTSLFPLFSYF